MINDIQKKVPKEKFNKPYDTNEPILNFYEQIDECLELSKGIDGINFTYGQVLQKSLYNLRATDIYINKK